MTTEARRRPVTETGRADHDAAWESKAGADADDWHMNHADKPEHCGGCDKIAAIEAEASRATLDAIEAAVRGLPCVLSGWKDCQGEGPHHLKQDAVLALIQKQRKGGAP